MAKVDMLLGEWLAKERYSVSSNGVPVSVLTSCCSQKFYKLCQARGNQGMKKTLQYLVPQPSTLWPRQEGVEAETSYSGLGE